MIDSWSRFLEGNRVRSVTGLLIVLALFASSIPFIERNPSPYFLSSEHPARVIKTEMTEYFTRSGETVLVNLVAKDNVFENAFIDMVEVIHELLMSIEAPIPEQDPHPIKSVKSLLNADNISDDDGDILVEPSFIQKQWTDVERSKILTNNLFQGMLVSENGKSLNIYVEFNVDPDDEILNHYLVDQITSVITKTTSEYGLVEQIHYGGIPVLNQTIAQITERDAGRFLLAVFSAVFVLLVVLLRSVRNALASVLVSLVSVIITLGCMKWLGFTINVVTTVLPIFIVTIAVTDAIHVLGHASSQTIGQRMEYLKRAMINTSITTSIGFLSLAYTEITQIQGLGVMVAVGIVVALFVTWTVLPLMKVSVAGQESKVSLVDEQKVRNVSRTIKYLSVIVCIFVAAIAYFGIPHVGVNQANIDSFSDDIKLKADAQIISDLGAGTVPLNVWIKDDDSVLRGSVLEALDEIGQLEGGDVVVASSLVDYLYQMHSVMGIEEPLDLNNKPLIEQYMVLLEGGAERDIETVFEPVSRKDTKAVLMMKNDDSKSIKVIRDQIDLILKKHGVSEYVITGYGALNVVAAQEVWTSQVRSMVMTFIIIFVVLLFMYRSTLIAVFALAPLAGTLLVMFGMMGIMDLSIDVGSSIVASIAIGIGIDYSIHIIEAWRRTGCIVRAVLEVRSPILVSACVLAGGFILMVFSDFEPIRSMGILISLAVVVSAVIALVLMPAIILLKDSVKSRALVANAG